MGPAMNDRDDQALRQLFQEAGTEEAPAGMDLRILQRIAVLPQPRVDVNAPLLPKWTWLLGAAALVALSAVLLSQPTGPSYLLSNVNLAAVLSSNWVLGSVLCAAALLGLDHWLGGKRSAAPARHGI